MTSRLTKTLSWGYCALSAWLAWTSPLSADESGIAFDLRTFAQEPRSQRNRVPAKMLTEPIRTRLLEVVGAGARGCDCQPRRLRWVWALPRPSDPRHPAIVVFFEDRPRARAQILLYERLAQLSFKDGKYQVTGVATFNRPHVGLKGSLSVRLLPRQDFDADGQLDLAVSFEEVFPETSACGRVLFQSGSFAPAFEAAACGAADEDE